MAIGAAVLAGIIGTLAFTILLYAAPMMGMPKMDIVGIIGTMFAEPGGAARALGVVGHFMMGAIFALVYALLWSSGVGAVTWVWGLIFGLVHGLFVGFIGMPMMMKMHPRAPEQEGGAKGLIGTLMGHALFGVVVALSYAALS